MLTFEKPPINEVVLGRRFLRRPDFLLPYFGVFWQRIAEQYPQVQQADPLLEPVEGQADWPLPRVWYLSADSTTLVQLQQDRILFNWRQTEAKNSYVRFPVVQESFLKTWDVLDRTVAELTTSNLQPTVGELTYVNLLESDGATSPVEIAKAALVDFRWSAKSPFLGEPDSFIWNFRLPSPNQPGTTLKVSCASATRKGSTSPLVKMELSVKGPCKGSESFADWSQCAHDFLVRSFKEITTPEMHSRWGLIADVDSR